MAVATESRAWLVVLLLLSVSGAWVPSSAAAARGEWKVSGAQVVEKESRRVVALSDAGTVTAADVADAAGAAYRLHFITMEPGALFLPVQLHADMVFYVHSGRGKVTYIEEGGSETRSLEVERGDVYNLEQGTIVYIQSYASSMREQLRVYAIFSSNGTTADDPSHPKPEAYSNVADLLKGFEVEILRLGFGVHREVVEAIKSAQRPPLIIPYGPEEEKESNWTEEILDALWGVRDPQSLSKKKDKDKHKKDKDKHKKDKKSKSKTFNFYSGKPDVENCYGWSKSMTNQDLQSLEGSNIGMFMVNLTTGSMMGPHWNPKATEIAIVTYGEGIVQAICPSIQAGKSERGHGEEGGDHHGGDRETTCKNSVFRVKEGDVFVVPRFHPMAQVSFNNEMFVFVGFSTHVGQNHPQFLAGKSSVLQVIGKEILALSLGQKNTTAVEKLLAAQRGSTIMACVSCADELAKKAKQDGGKGKKEQDEERRREKEEREQEERKREEEEMARREQEEEQRREEEERARREQEEEKRRREEEERARREQEEEKRREEEGGDEPRREKEEGAEGEEGDSDWGEPRYKSSKYLKKRYRDRKAVF